MLKEIKVAIVDVLMEWSRVLKNAGFKLQELAQRLQ